jgi:bifunctional DNase/RNase
MTDERMAAVEQIYLKSEPGAGNMVILKEKPDSERYFMMFVGDSEFAAIAKEKGLVEAKRPLTHDVYLGLMDKTDVKFLFVEIYEMRQETYYANVIISSKGVDHAVDSRPSDAVALALNRKIPIMVNEKLFRRELTQEEISEYEGIVKKLKF